MLWDGTADAAFTCDKAAMLWCVTENMFHISSLSVAAI
jgi:hypothetical protein